MYCRNTGLLFDTLLFTLCRMFVIITLGYLKPLCNVAHNKLRVQKQACFTRKLFTLK